MKTEHVKSDQLSGHFRGLMDTFVRVLVSAFNFRGRYRELFVSQTLRFTYSVLG